MKLKKLFVVFDPTRSHQPALERAANIAGVAGAELHVFACIHETLDKNEDKAEQTRKLIAEQREVLEEALEPIHERGIFATSEVEWDKDWARAAVRASIRHHADVVLKSSYPSSPHKRVLNRTSDFTLIRECVCPVLLVKECETCDSRRVLAAVDMSASTESYAKLNDQIIELSQKMMEAANAEVHFVNAFKELKAVPDRKELIEKSGVDSERIHIQRGAPEDVIVKQARNLDAGLVVVGNSGRSGVLAMINGNTVEKVLNKLDCDILSIP